jgi:glycosyltransferase involved in cell wall biosynthesis
MIFKYKYDISIVMGYYNRKLQIINTLNYFENYKEYNYEVIIVDDNSTRVHQLDDIIKNYTFPIKYIKITAEEKGDRINPCVTYNRGFKEAEGERVIIQNPECIHRGNILEYVKTKLTYDDYIAFSCYNCSSFELTQELLKNVSLINSPEFDSRNSFKWYNHPTIRPVHYHFCAAIMNDNIKLLGGFNEEFAKGACFDDNEILLSIKQNLKLNIKSIYPDEGGFVIHQWHPRDAESKFTQIEYTELLRDNQKLYENYLNAHSTYQFQFPKLLHLYWDGTPLSYLNLLTVLSFNKYHIGWKINVFCPIKRNEHISWTTHEQKKIYTGIDYFDELKNIQNVNIHYIDTDLLPFEHKDASEVIKSDYFRLYILNRYGGLWSDFDIIYTNNIEKYYSNKNLKTTKNMILYNYKCMLNQSFKIYPVGMFLSKKNNSILNTLLKYINLFYDKTNYQCLGCTMFQNIFNHYDKDDMFKTIFTEMNLKELYIDNADCYLKVKWNQLDTFYKNKNVATSLFEQDANIFSIHWFNGGDASKEYCNNLDLEILKNSEASCLIDKFVKQYI